MTTKHFSPRILFQVEPKVCYEKVKFENVFKKSINFDPSSVILHSRTPKNFVTQDPITFAMTDFKLTFESPNSRSQNKHQKTLENHTTML